MAWPASAVCCVCKSYVVFALLPAQSAVCCVCTTASAVCCVCKSCVVFALLPVQCAVCGSPVLCLHYCQHSVLCVWVLYCVCTTASAVCRVCKSCVVFVQYTFSAVCCAGDMISPLIILFCNFLLFLPIPTSSEWISTGFSILTAS